MTKLVQRLHDELTFFTGRFRFLRSKSNVSVAASENDRQPSQVHWKRERTSRLHKPRRRLTSVSRDESHVVPDSSEFVGNRRQRCPGSRSS